jgi:hypothetical protein
MTVKVLIATKRGLLSPLKKIASANGGSYFLIKEKPSRWLQDGSLICNACHTKYRLKA